MPAANHIPREYVWHLRRWAVSNMNPMLFKRCAPCAGKSTLLDILSERKGGRVSGQVCMLCPWCTGGKKYNPSLKDQNCSLSCLYDGILACRSTEVLPRIMAKSGWCRRYS